MPAQHKHFGMVQPNEKLEFFNHIVELENWVNSNVNDV